MTLTDFLNSINLTKKNLIDESDSPEAAAKVYPAFVTARSLSYFSNTVLLVNELNKCGTIDNKMHYDFLLNIIPKGKRFAKWAKPAKSDTIKKLVEIHNISYKKAEELAYVLTDAQLAELLVEPAYGGKL